MHLDAAIIYLRRYTIIIVIIFLDIYIYIYWLLIYARVCFFRRGTRHNNMRYYNNNIMYYYSDAHRANLVINHSINRSDDLYAGTAVLPAYSTAAAVYEPCNIIVII